MKIDLPATEHPRIVQGAVELQHRWTPGGLIGDFLKSLERKELFSTDGQFYPAISRGADFSQGTEPSFDSGQFDRKPLSVHGFSFDGGSLLYDGWPGRNGIEGVDEQRSFLALISHPDLKAPFVHRVCAGKSKLDTLKLGTALVFAGPCFLVADNSGQHREDKDRLLESGDSIASGPRTGAAQTEPAHARCEAIAAIDEAALDVIRSKAGEVDQVIVVTPQPESLRAGGNGLLEKAQVIQAELFSVHSLLYEVQAFCEQYGRVLLIAPAFFYQAAARSTHLWKFNSVTFVLSGVIPQSLKKEFEQRYATVYSVSHSSDVDPLTEQLYAHPAVIDAVVARGRKNRAMVILRQNAKEDERQMREFYRRKGIVVDDVQIVDAFLRKDDGSVDTSVLLEEERRLREGVSVVEGSLRIEYEWHCGSALSRFYDGLQHEGRFYGTVCSKCQRVQVPPKLYCGVCFADAFEFVALPDTGVVESCTTVHLEFPGQPAKPPYTYGYIKLDGASTHFYHLLDGDVVVGDRVKAIWQPADQRKGAMADVQRFTRI